ncbi:MAG: hypothetical protein ACTHL7_14325 [Steroidobacteraceae bacterium]
MTDITSFLAAEFTEIGLAAAADPHFAERFIEALRRLPRERDARQKPWRRILRCCARN